MPEPGDRFVKERDYAKRYRWRPWNRLRRSKAAREWRRYQIMQALGLPCPANVEIEDTRNRLGLLVKSRISMQRLDHAIDLRYLHKREEYAHLRRDQRFRRALVREVAKWVKVMQDNHFYHLNLNFRNVLVDVESTDPPSVYFIDCTGGGFCRLPWREPYLRLKEIAFLYKDARSWCSLREMVLFMHVLIGRNKLDAADRQLLGRIVSYAQRKWGDTSSAD